MTDRRRGGQQQPDRTTDVPTGQSNPPPDTATGHLARLRRVLAHHLQPDTDPCCDRGVDWPCDVATALCPDTAMRVEGPAVEHTPGVPTCPQCGHRVDAHGDTTTGDADRGCRWTEPGGPICPCPLTLATARRPNPSADSYGG